MSRDGNVILTKGFPFSLHARSFFLYLFSLSLSLSLSLSVYLTFRATFPPLSGEVELAGALFKCRLAICSKKLEIFLMLCQAFSKRQRNTKYINDEK